jgi:CheY-like chemotaxis protein
MSHEIRSPMNAVLGSLGLLLEGDLSKDQRLYARTAETSGKALLSLINDILDFSKIEAGHLTLDSMDFNVHELAREAMDLAAFRARDKVLPVMGVVATDVPAWLCGDMARLRQILSNLLDNALKFTEQGGVVLRVERLRSDTASIKLRFSVEDSGIGIRIGAQETLFEEFQQVDNSDSTRFGGTGLGLSICKGLANLMNGSIGVDSTSGKGSRFWVDIPFHTSTGNVKQQSTQQLDLHGALVIGFDPLMGEALADMCVNAGCPTVTASSLAEAVAISGDEIQLIMVDGRLGGGEIDAIAQEARSNGVDRLLLVAPHGSSDLVARVARGQFDDLVTTPLVIQDLTDGLLGMSSRENEHSPLMPQESATPESGVRARLLLAEDSPANQLVATAMLRKANYEVDIANNGQEAIEMFRNGVYDAILMDLRMPEVDGLEATAEIRGMARGRQVPIIAMTANAMKEDVDRCLAAGMDDFVSKPVNKRRLLDILERCLTDSTAHATVDQPGPVDGVQTAPLLDVQTLQQLASDVPPEVIPAMIQTFIDEMVARAKTIAVGCESEPMAALQDEAHTLKSTAGTFGAFSMHEVARDLEAACRAENHGQVIHLGKQIKVVLQQTLAAYQAHFDYLHIDQEVEKSSISAGAR